jgi:hypothetical protein
MKNKKMYALFDKQIYSTSYFETKKEAINFMNKLIAWKLESNPKLKNISFNNLCIESDCIVKKIEVKQ